MTEGARENAGELTGRLVGGRYRLGRLLGQGGMGVVYTATQESLARPVAVKVLQPALAQNLDAVARFRAEAERAGRLAHPHIVQILDFGHEDDGAAWIAMELLSGEPLAARIERGPMPEGAVVRVAMETLSALEAAHGASLVHRDLKPDNIFLADVPGIGASVKVLDFGIAKLLEGDGAQKLTATGMLVGTPLYMAPEQARGEDVDARADLYSLGCVLYEALTGRPPLTGKNYNALLFAILSEVADPVETLRPEISPVLAEVVRRAIEKNPGQRFASAREMADALRPLAPSSHPPSSPPASRPSTGELAMGSAPTLATPQPSRHAPASDPSMGHAPTLATPQPTPRVDDLARTAPLGGATAAPAGPASGPPATTPPAATAIVTPPATTATPEPVPTPSAGAPASSRTWMVAGLVATLAALAVLVVDRTFLREAPPAPPVTSVATAPAPPSPPQPPPMVPMEAPPPPTATSQTAIGLSPHLGEPAAPAPEPVPEPTSIAPTSVAPSSITPEPVPEPTSIEPARPRPARPARPRFAPRVSLGSLRWGGMQNGDALRGPINAEGGWGECWPGDVEPPTVNRSRDFWIEIDPDGSVASVEPTAASTEPAAFAECVVRRLRTLTFPAPVTGARVRVQVGFGIGS